MLKKLLPVLILLFCLSAIYAYRAEAAEINITEIKMASAVDENLMPVQPATVFPKGTAKVFCWFKWQGAELNAPIIAKWHFVTDDIHILDYPFAIPRKEGSGGVSLSMPDGKVLPSGDYRVDLALGKKVLRSAKFRVE